MDDIFITAIEIKKVRNIENFTIPLSETERKHLIITGKNGSGKTSLLLEINRFIQQMLISPPNEYFIAFDFIQGKVEKHFPKGVVFDSNAKNHFELIVSNYGGTHITFKNSNSFYENRLAVLFESKRHFELNIPTGINKVELQKSSITAQINNKNFVQYIVNLKAERSFAKDENDNEAVIKIDEWFFKFENQLKELFDAPDLKLVFDRKNYNFYIQIDNNEPFNLNQLSDGYSAVLSIITELILRMEATGNKAYDVQGVVLIDEIETHLHVALQKKIMPFLCAFFPNIQFIVTTHSPFVILSLKNAVVCDLEKKEVISEDLTGYSYDALVESYFDTDRYSQEIKEKLQIFESLSEKMELTEDEEDLHEELEEYFENLPKFKAKELEAKLQQIQLKKLGY